MRSAHILLLVLECLLYCYFTCCFMNNTGQQQRQSKMNNTETFLVIQNTGTTTQSN